MNVNQTPDPDAIRDAMKLDDVEKAARLAEVEQDFAARRAQREEALREAEAQALTVSHDVAVERIDAVLDRLSGKDEANVDVVVLATSRLARQNQLRARAELPLAKARELKADIEKWGTTYLPKVQALARVSDAAWDRGAPTVACPDVSPGDRALAFSLLAHVKKAPAAIIGVFEQARGQVARGIREVESLIGFSVSGEWTQNTDGNWHAAMRDLEAGSDAVSVLSSQFRQLSDALDRLQELKARYVGSEAAWVPPGTAAQINAATTGLRRLVSDDDAEVTGYRSVADAEERSILRKQLRGEVAVTEME